MSNFYGAGTYPCSKNHSSRHETSKCLLTGENRKFLKIADFGISKLSAATMAMSIVGTPYYLAPELCEGHEYGYKADLWASGIILYEMSNLKRPFDASSLPALIMKIMQAEYEPICVNTNGKDRISTYTRDDIIPLVSSLLNRRPKGRPSASECCKILRDDIQEWLKIKKLVIESSLEYAQTYAKNLEVEMNPQKIFPTSNSNSNSTTMKTVSFSRLQSSPTSNTKKASNGNSSILHENKFDLTKYNPVKDKYANSPLESRNAREKMSHIITTHSRLWRVGRPNPKLLHEFLHVDIDALEFGGMTSEDVEDFGSPNENCVFALPKTQKKGAGETQEAGFLAFGINDENQLGFDSNGREVKENRPVHACKDFNSITSISSGDGFTMMSDEDGRVFACGSFSWIDNVEELKLCLVNRVVEQEMSTSEESLNPFRRGSALSDISFSSEAGKNIFKAMEYGDLDNCHTPLQIKSIANHRIKSVSCGSDFAILLSENGCCFSLGRGDEGVLGVENESDHSVPTLIEALSNIVAIRCGARHVLAKSKNCDELYSWGSNTYGQLGLGGDSNGDDVDNLQVPKLISEFRGIDVVQFECGWWHNAVISRDGNLYTWGMNESGQLGLGRIDDVGMATPAINSFFQEEDEAIIYVSCGAFHTVCINEDNLVYGFGSNKQYAIGQRDQKTYYTPVLIKSFCSRKYIGQSIVSKAFCGINRTYILAEVSNKDGEEDDFKN